VSHLRNGLRPTRTRPGAGTVARVLVHTRCVEPSADDIRRQLERILASGGFANAERMSRFLRYVVERSIAGESEQIKEYSIGVDVFGRNAEYDPRLDSIVRVEARRLRSKLDEYYAADGRHDDVIISIRRGAYVPAFERRKAEPTAPPLATPTPTSDSRRFWRAGIAIAMVVVAIVSFAAWRRGLWATQPATPAISLAVLPFSHYSTEAADVLLAGRLTEDLTSELARLGAVRVIAHTSVLQFTGTRIPAQQIASSLNADLLIEGSVSRSGPSLDASIRLIGGRSNYKLWVQNFTGPANDPRELARRIAATLSTAIQGKPEMTSRETAR
jgi:TolB-like protein